MRFSVLKLMGLALGTALLTGCATGYLLDNNVQAFSNLSALPAQPTYRFDRLPSQQGPGQAQLEAMADAALHKAGLRRDDAKPRHGVQVTARVQRVLSPWADPWDGWVWGASYGRRHGRLGLMSSFESPWFHREVTVIVRELATNKVVFETRSTNDGPWRDDGMVIPAMFEASLQGFPQPPSGRRRVDIAVGR